MMSLDAESLLKLARDKSQAGRTALAETISDLFVDKSTVLTDRERALLFDILRRMVHDLKCSCANFSAKIWPRGSIYPRT